jgi:hypothetical protein
VTIAKQRRQIRHQPVVRRIQQPHEPFMPIFTRRGEELPVPLNCPLELQFSICLQRERVRIRASVRRPQAIPIGKRFRGAAQAASDLG